MLPTVVCSIFFLVTLGASMGVLLLSFLLLTVLGIDSELTLIVIGIVGAMLVVINMILISGYCGALVNEYYRALHGQRVGITSFMRYAFKNSPQFFVIVLVKLIVIGFFITPLALLYYFMDLGSIHSAILYIFVAVALFIWLIIDFLFAFSFIAYVEKRVKPLSAILISLNFIKDTHIKAFLVYALYVIVCLALMIPLLNILVYFVFYPMAMASLIKFFEKESARY